MKSYNQTKLKEKTKEVNDILRLIYTNNITETQQPSIYRSKTGSGSNGNKDTSK